MNNTTLNTIRQHIIKNEKPVKYSYLDIKGNLTIGPGFKIETEEEFVALPLDNVKAGRKATDQEKRDEFANMQRIRESRDRFPEGLNRKAETYENDATLHMDRDDQGKHLDKEISTRIDKVKTDVGVDAWEKLSDGQKAVAVDIHYANGSLQEFAKYKEAIINGDPEAMARESTFFTDKATGKRDMDRLAHNRAAITGEDMDTAKKLLDEQLNGQTAETPSGEEPGDTAGPGGDGSAGDGEGEAQSHRPEVQDSLDDLKQPVDPVSDIMSKDYRNWTEEELAQVHGSDLYQRPSSPRRAEAFGKVNRVRRARERGGYWWGDTLGGVCQKPWQFSCWNEGDPNREKILAVTPKNRSFQSCIRIARRAAAGAIDDPTGGSTHYHAKYVNPPWARRKAPSAEIGRHLFYANIE